MIPTRAFQKYNGGRVVGFDPFNSAFCVLQENTVTVVKNFVTRYKGMPKIEILDKRPSENNSTLVWDDVTTEFVRHYSNEIFHFLKLTIGSSVEQIKTHIIISSLDSCFYETIRLHSGLLVHLPNYFPYHLRLSYTEVDFKEFT